EDDQSTADRGPGQSGGRGSGLTTAAELAEAEDDAAEGERGENDREDVDRRVGRLAEVGHPLRTEGEGDEPDRQDDAEEPAPAEAVEHDARHRRADRRSQR